ncbi:flagellar basal-body MS-ring/collar protein FliF [Acidithiobacillus sulfuriphilus]|uniref:flagellar basal-body MS-ring/collar protein FliF n=1 Tax=Acidithiobacillus sulfuriphilus TaxID=1867749 RepID=UPI003F6072E7
MATESAKTATQGVVTAAAQVQARWQELPANRRFALLAWLAALLAIVVVAFLWVGKPSYKVLFTNLSERDGGLVIAQLQKLNVPYRITDGGAVIAVPGDEVYTTRMKLAAAGLPKGAGVGFELLEHEPLGTSQFVEQVNYQRALEGSLERTIQSLSAVESAKVHVAIPKPSVFLSEQEKPTASVLLQLYPGRVLSTAQVAGIVHLVAASIPGLDDKSVTVVDQHGDLLTTNANTENNGLQPTQLAYQRQIEHQYQRRIEEILAPLVGHNGVRVAVSADLDFAKTESSSVQYGKGQMLSQQTRGSSWSGGSGGSGGVGGAGGAGSYGVPGALSNQPPGVAVAPLTAPVASAMSPGDLMALGPTLKMLAPTQSSSDQTTNYDLDKTITHTVQPVGTVKRLSVAVLVNDRTVEGANGKVTVQPLSAAQLAQVQQLVEDAIGYSQQRGDTVKVVNMPFTAEAAPSAVAWWKQGWFLIFVDGVLRYGVLLILGLLLYFGVVRPMLRRRREQAPTLETEGGAKAAGGGEHPAPRTEPAIVRAAEHHEPIVLPGNPLETDLYVARQLVMQDAGRAAQVVKEWLANDRERGA